MSGPVAELVEPDGAAGERMPGRAREDHLVPEERLEGHGAVTAGGADDPELQPAVGDQLDHRLRVGHGQLDAQLGVLPLELAEQHREHDRRGTGGGAQLERAVERRVGLGELVEQLLLERQHPLGAAVESQPGLGRLDPASGPVEQLCPEPLLQRPHLLRNGRLGDPQPGGSLREAAPLDHLAECRQLARVHKRTLSSERYRLPMRVWVDLTNSPHVLVFRPLIRCCGNGGTRSR